MLLIIVPSCCLKESVEVAKYELSPGEQSLLPYSKGEIIKFIHSNGYEFDIKVTKSKLEWKQHYDFCEWNCCGQDYFSYQTKTATLESSYPKFRIQISLGGRKYMDYLPQNLDIALNYDHSVQFPYDSLNNFICDSVSKTIFYDSIPLNNQMYHKVIMKNFEHYGFTNDSTMLIPQSIYYNQKGILQIKMSNNETYTINN